VAHGEHEHVLRVRPPDAGFATLAFSGFWLFLGIDSLLARHYLPRAESGFYAAAATASRAVLFLPAAIALIAFPQFVASEGRSPESRRSLVHALAAVGTIGGVAALAIVAFPRLFVTTIFGNDFGTSTVVVGVLAISAAA